MSPRSNHTEEGEGHKPFPSDDWDTAPEQIIEAFREAKGEADDALWMEADLCSIWRRHFLAHRRDKTVHPAYGMKMFKWLAGEIGMGTRALENYAKTADTFPVPPPDAAPDDYRYRVTGHEYIRFQHHNLCAPTDDPAGWLKKATEMLWSTIDLEAAIKASKGEVPPEKCPKRSRRDWCTVYQKCVAESECEGCPHRPAEKTEEGVRE